jgi:spore cortex protein
MQKKTSFLAVAVLASGVLAGCNANNDMLDNNNLNETRPIGYHTNDGDFTQNNNNRGLDRGEGPLTEMMDNDENRLGQNNSPENNIRNNTMLNNDNGENNNRNGNNNGEGRYADGYDGQLAERIENRVKKINNVEDAQVIIAEDNILVGIDTNDQNDQNLDEEVRNSVKQLSNKEVRVADDEDIFNRIGDIGNNLRNGEAFEEVQSDVNNIFDDLGDAVQRPFQDNQ